MMSVVVVVVVVVVVPVAFSWHWTVCSRGIPNTPEWRPHRCLLCSLQTKQPMATRTRGVSFKRALLIC